MTWFKRLKAWLVGPTPGYPGRILSKQESYLGTVAVRLHTETDTFTMTETWQVGPAIVMLTLDMSPRLHSSNVHIDFGDWEHSWDAEPDASMAGLLSEAIRYIASLPQE